MAGHFAEMCQRMFLRGQPRSFLVRKSMLIAELPGNQAGLSKPVDWDRGEKVMLKVVVGAAG